jgi:hypothetical protein
MKIRSHWRDQAVGRRDIPETNLVFQSSGVTVDRSRILVPVCSKEGIIIRYFTTMTVRQKRKIPPSQPQRFPRFLLKPLVFFGQLAASHPLESTASNVT